MSVAAVLTCSLRHCSVNIPQSPKSGMDSGDVVNRYADARAVVAVFWRWMDQYLRSCSGRDGRGSRQ